MKATRDRLYNPRSNGRNIWLARVCALLLMGSAIAQSTPDAAPPHAQADHEYATLLGHVQQGDMGIDFTAFRRDGAIVASTHISMLEVGDRVNFKRAMAASDPQRALDSSNSLLGSGLCERHRAFRRHDGLPRAAEDR